MWLLLLSFECCQVHCLNADKSWCVLRLSRCEVQRGCCKGLRVASGILQVHTVVCIHGTRTRRTEVLDNISSSYLV